MGVVTEKMIAVCYIISNNITTTSCTEISQHHVNSSLSINQSSIITFVKHLNTHITLFVNMVQTRLFLVQFTTMV
jgi:hypothetical protein